MVFLYLPKISRNLLFSNVLKGYKKRTVAWNPLLLLNIPSKIQVGQVDNWNFSFNAKSWDQIMQK